MFSVLNRLRGTFGWMAKVNGVLIGALFYLFWVDIYTSIAVAMLYVVGESFGWGKWFGGIFHGENTPQAIKDEDEGINNGVHWLANLIVPQDKDFYRYSILALGLRGALWFGLTLIPLAVMGYIGFNDWFMATVLLGVAFPLSVVIGKKTSEKWKFKFMDGFWEHSEVWYGVTHDIMLVIILGMVI